MVGPRGFEPPTYWPQRTVGGSDQQPRRKERKGRIALVFGILGAMHCFLKQSHGVAQQRVAA